MCRNILHNKDSSIVRTDPCVLLSLFAQQKIQQGYYLHHSKHTHPPRPPRHECENSHSSGGLEFAGVGSASRNRTAAPAFFLLLSQNKQQRKGHLSPLLWLTQGLLETNCLQSWPLLQVTSQIMIRKVQKSMVLCWIKKNPRQMKSGMR